MDPISKDEFFKSDSERKMENESAVGKGLGKCDINARQLDGITCYGAPAAVEMALLSVARHQCGGLG